MPRSFVVFALAFLTLPSFAKTTPAADATQRFAGTYQFVSMKMPGDDRDWSAEPSRVVVCPDHLAVSLAGRLEGRRNVIATGESGSAQENLIDVFYPRSDAWSFNDIGKKAVSYSSPYQNQSWFFDKPSFDPLFRGVTTTEQSYLAAHDTVLVRRMTERAYRLGFFHFGAPRISEESLTLDESTEPARLILRAHVNQVLKLQCVYRREAR